MQNTNAWAFHKAITEKCKVIFLQHPRHLLIENAFTDGSVIKLKGLFGVRTVYLADFIASSR
jgi:hypothetical protein